MFKRSDVPSGAVVTDEQWEEAQAGWIKEYGEKAKKRNRPVFVGRVRRENWRADLPIYLRWCNDCTRYTACHPAGYGRITCQGCRDTMRVMTWQRFRDKVIPPVRDLVLIFFVSLAALAVGAFLGTAFKG
jgi:hypothetical protein